MQTSEALFRQSVVAHGPKRAALFRLGRERFAPETVVYVDRHPQAVGFFAAAEDVRRFVSARRPYRPPAYVRCLAADGTGARRAAVVVREGARDG